MSNDYSNLSLQLVDGSVTLVPAHKAKHSHLLISDPNLMWDTFMVAHPQALATMHEEGWLDDRINMFDRFWGNIVYYLTTIPTDKDAMVMCCALLLYQSEQHQLWHVATQLPTTTYNLATLNINLVKMCITHIKHQDSNAAEHGHARAK